MSAGHEAGARFRSFVDAVLPPRRLPGAEEVRAQRERLRDAADGYAPVNLGIGWTDQLDAFGFEGDCLMMLDIDEVGALEMCVARRFASPQLSGVDDHSHFGALRRSRIEVQRAVNIFERSAHVRDHHVAHAEFGGGMSWLEGPAHRRTIP